MDASSAPANQEKRLLTIGVNQWIALGFTLLGGGLLALRHDTWWTFSGALLGILLSLVLITVSEKLLLMPSVIRTGSLILNAFFSMATFVAGNTLSTEGCLIFSQIVSLWRKLWRIVVEARPAVACHLVLAGLLKSPLKYLGWYAIGVLVHGIFACQTAISQGLSIAPFLMYLDLPIGIFILLAALRDTIQDLERDAQARAEQTVPDRISNQLTMDRPMHGKSLHESRESLALLREAVRKNSFRIGKFVTSGSGFLESSFNMCILLGVLLWISPLGGVLALFALITMIPIRIHDLVSIKQSEDDAFIPRAELGAAERFTVDTRVQGLLYSIAKPEYFAQYLAEKRSRIFSIKENIRSANGQRRTVARVVFFTLFALSAVEPVYAGASGDLSVRLAMLYFFSLLGLWGSLSAVTERASRLVENLDDLPQVEEALALLETPLPSIPASVSPAQQLSTSIEFEKTRFNYPFRPQLLRFAGQIIVGKTISMAKVVKVVGAPRSGTSTLLKLIAGRVKPSVTDEQNRRSIRIGGVSTAEQDMTTWVMLVPDEFPDCSGLKVGELFRAICGPGLLDIEIEGVLQDFGLLDEIEVEGDAFSGLELLIGYQGRHLTAEQRQVLFLALNYVALKARLSDRGSFNPAVIAVDGISKLTSLERRRKIISRYQALCDEFHATFVCVVRHKGEIDDTDFVLTIINPSDLPEDYANQGDSNVVSGEVHTSRWNNPDKTKKTYYRNWLGLVENRY